MGDVSQFSQTGKLAPDLLKTHILRHSGALRKEVLVGPLVGEDAAVIDFPKDKLLVVSSDPVVGAEKGAGALLVHINVNDIASKGGDPAYLLVTMIFPHSFSQEKAELVMQDISDTASSMGIAVVGGHTEFSHKYETPVLSATLIGLADRCMSMETVCPGDRVVMTKHAGIEGMNILGGDRPDLLSFFSSDELEEIVSWSGCLSVLPESRIMRSQARFMHDPTEGGILGGLGEMQMLSFHALEIWEDSIPCHPYTREAARNLCFNPLSLISSGVLLGIIPEDSSQSAVDELEKSGISASVIGKVLDRPSLKSSVLPFAEELWKLLDLPQR